MGGEEAMDGRISRKGAFSVWSETDWE